MGFCLAIESSWMMSTGQTTLQRCGETVLDKLLAHSPNRRGAYFQRLTDVLICPAWSCWTRIGFEQDARVKQFSCCPFSCGHGLMEIRSFICCKGHNVFLIHFLLLELVQ
jgi:hypothetical protein